MAKLSVGEIISQLDETEQKQAAILRAILTTELDRWEQERRHTLQHPQALPFVLTANEPLEILMECDWFYIFSADPPVDAF